MIGLYFAIIILVCYLIGNINFAKITVRLCKKEDITQKGSGNPGTMNVLRNYGIGMGLLVLMLEAIKAGLPALISALIMQNFGLYDLAFFVAGASAILGQVYPVLYKFKGGKGVACTAGLFFFTAYWWVAIIVFFLCAVFLYLVDYAFLSSLAFVTIMSAVLIYAECVKNVAQLWIIIVIILSIWIFLIINHRSNFKRFFANKENKTGFRHKVLMAFSKKYREWIKQEEIKELRKKEAAKKFLEEQEKEHEQKKEEKEKQKEIKKGQKKEEKLLEKQQKLEEKEKHKAKRLAKKAKRKAKRRAKKRQRKIKHTDKRVKKMKNGKRNPFKHHSKKKKEN